MIDFNFLTPTLSSRRGSEMVMQVIESKLYKSCVDTYDYSRSFIHTIARHKKNSGFNITCNQRNRMQNFDSYTLFSESSRYM
jgi:hypothetical protein